MCRNIKQLRPKKNASDGADQPATADEIKAAALQYVRKVSGYRIPARANQAVFEQAVAQVAAATQALLEGLARPAH
jgi:hypothetical protein